MNKGGKKKVKKLSYRSGVEILLRNLTIIKWTNKTELKEESSFMCVPIFHMRSYNTAVAEKRYKRHILTDVTGNSFFRFFFSLIHTHTSLLVKYFRKFTGNNISHIKWHQKSNLELLDARLLSFFSFIQFNRLNDTSWFIWWICFGD